MTKKDIAAMLEDGLTEDDIMKMVKEVKAEQEKKKLDAAEAAKKQEKIKVARERAVRALLDYMTVLTGETMDPTIATRVNKNFEELEHLNDLIKKAPTFSARVAKPGYAGTPKTDLEWADLLLNKYFD
jgi:siroheme synthase